MKYIFFTFSGLGLPIAYKLQQEGHDVIVGQIQDIKDYVMEEEAPHAKEELLNKQRRLQLFQGMLPIQDAQDVLRQLHKIDRPHEYFVFFEENNLYRWADKVRDMGFEGNFPTKEDYLFEIDRDRAKQFVKAHYPKLHVPIVHEFATVKEGIAFLKQSEDIWVLKGKDDHAKTFVPSVEDISLAKGQIIEMLSNFPKDYEKLGFILELYIPSLIELTPEKLYYDGVPLATTLDIENKNFGSGNTSIQTGCAEDLVFPTNMDDKLNKIAFPPIVDEMARAHKGLFIWDASILINRRDGKLYFGEFCSNRPGYNSLFTELAQCPSIDAFFEAVVHKNSPFTLGTVGTSVRLFNLNRDEETEQISSNISVDFKSEVEKDLWLWDVKKKDKGRLFSVGTDWNLAVATGAGKSIDEAIAKTYNVIHDFAFVGAYYRAQDDFLSLEYSSSIINRLNYGLEKGLYTLPFNVHVRAIEVK
ncbi:MAG: hypothetical protein ACR2LN_00960 [Candidatus Levyibacteriota bacterium]